jgi:selenocysteine-specific elongation factor
METRNIIFGTAGHIDHGKSTLVEALTGTHPDRLEEEKRRGITIDLGFAFLNSAGVRIGFVDVPGHEKFVGNMLAGAGGIDRVLLVVAADESIKPQTREHFDICRLFGIPRGVVAITKADLVEPDVVALVRLEVEEFVRDSFLEGAPIVPVSARSGAGLEILKRELVKSALLSSIKDASQHLRLPIDRSFAMKGFGTVVTGTLIAGTVKIEDEVELYPTGRRLRVRGLQSGGAVVESAVAGQRTAVNLAGIDYGEIRRGMVLAAPATFETTDRFDARITLLSGAKPLKNRASVHFHQGTMESIAEAILLGPEELGPGQECFAQLRLKEKTLLLPGDRLILRQFSPAATIGGGTVIDIRATRHRRADMPAVARQLEKLGSENREEILCALTGAMPGGASLAELVARTGWTQAQIRESVGKLSEQGRIRVISGQPLAVASNETLAKCVTALREAVEVFHRQNPLLPGVPRQDLRSRVGNPRSELFEAGLRDLLQAGGLAMAGDLIQRAGRRVELSPGEARAKELIEREFEQAGLAVPSFAAVVEKLAVESGRAQGILQILLREKILIKVAADLVLHRNAVTQLRSLLARYQRERGNRLPIPVFKELTGVTRKYAIPLLEYLDREQVTRRVGDERVIL